MCTGVAALLPSMFYTTRDAAGHISIVLSHAVTLQYPAFKIADDLRQGVSELGNASRRVTIPVRH